MEVTDALFLSDIDILKGCKFELWFEKKIFQFFFANIQINK